jgi:diketogulonate reductase-like aldo/keto reductase
MNANRYKQVRDNLLATANDIENAKRGAYTVGSDDVLANFKRVAERIGSTPAQVALTYYLKHIDSIITMVKRPDIIDPEPAIGRFADTINYTKLLYAILVEEQETKDE